MGGTTLNEDNKNSSATNTSDIVERVCKRPSMYVGRVDLELVNVFLWGHFGRELEGIAKLAHGDVLFYHPWPAFHDWLASKLSCSSKEVVEKIRELVKNDEEGIAYFASAYQEFKNLKKETAWT